MDGPRLGNKIIFSRFLHKFEVLILTWCDSLPARSRAVAHRLAHFCRHLHRRKHIFRHIRLGRDAAVEQPRVLEGQAGRIRPR